MSAGSEQRRVSTPGVNRPSEFNLRFLTADVSKNTKTRNTLKYTTPVLRPGPCVFVCCCVAAPSPWEPRLPAEKLRCRIAFAYRVSHYTMSSSCIALPSLLLEPVCASLTELARSIAIHFKEVLHLKNLGCRACVCRFTLPPALSVFIDASSKSVFDFGMEICTPPRTVSRMLRQRVTHTNTDDMPIFVRRKT